MTTSALVTISIAWSVTLFFMIRFLIKVLRTPLKDDQKVKE